VGDKKEEKMNQEKKKLTDENLIFKAITPSGADERQLLKEDLDLIIDGLEYKRIVDEVGEDGFQAQLFLKEHPNAKSGLQLAEKVLLQ
jgi:hypothetical protein